MNDLMRAKILIAELVSVIALDNLNEPQHWIWKYRDICHGFVSIGARHCPRGTIESHMRELFDTKEVQPCSN